MATDSYSIVEYCGVQEKYKCGYCKSPNTNFSYGMITRMLTVQDYQALIDRGWRRCGHYCYKSIMDQICCPMYTIKCEAMKFKISKSQKKILKRMGKFLKNELNKDDVMDTYKEDHRDNIDIDEIPHDRKGILNATETLSNIDMTLLDDKANEKSHPPGLEKSNSEMKKKTLKNIPAKPVCDKDSISTSKSLQSVEMQMPRAPCMKAKFLRKQRKQNKLLGQGKSQEEVEAIMNKNKQENHVKTLEELFNELCTGSDRLKLKLLRTSEMSSEYLKTSKQSYEVYKKYEIAIHGVPAEIITEQKYRRFLVESPLQRSYTINNIIHNIISSAMPDWSKVDLLVMKLVRVMSDEFMETLKVSASLFKKYQMAIHDETEEESDDESFMNFLVKSPLQPWTPDDGPPCGYGSFHEQYWLDNELIAVGVIDILPLGISSVYFFYDPAYPHLSLGTFSSLREVWLTRQLNKSTKDLEYYYMGFYIHSCPKMRYKARMRPSKLLCPETYAWFDIDPCLLKLDKQKYSRFNDDIDAIDENGIVNICKVLVLYRHLYRHVAMPYEIYKQLSHTNVTQKEEDEIEEYASLVGMQCAQRLLLYRCG